MPPAGFPAPPPPPAYVTFEPVIPTSLPAPPAPPLFPFGEFPPTAPAPPPPPPPEADGLPTGNPERPPLLPCGGLTGGVLPEPKYCD